MNWISTMLPLGGVILGTGSTLLGQYLTLRIDVRRDATRHSAEQRAERKEAIVGFLNAAEHIEQRRGNPSAHDEEQPTLNELVHNVWLAKKVLELVCSQNLAQAAHDYSRCLSPFSHAPDRSTEPGELEPLTAREVKLRAKFLEAARQEMGYTGTPLQRKASRYRYQTAERAIAAPDIS